MTAVALGRRFECTGCKKCVLARAAMDWLDDPDAVSMPYTLPSDMTIAQCVFFWKSIDNKFGKIMSQERDRIKRLLKNASALSSSFLLSSVGRCPAVRPACPSAPYDRTRAGARGAPPHRASGPRPA